MPTKYALTREQEEEIIEWAVSHGIVQAEEQETKPKTLIDKYGLQKLFWNSKFRDPKPTRHMPTLVVRCHHDTMQWKVMVAGVKNPKIHLKDSIVLSDVQFLHQQGTEMAEIELGCGVTDIEQVHTGYAKGEFAPHIPAVIPAMSRKLKYDREIGSFCDAETGQVLDRAAYLVLMNGCKHGYVPVP